MAHCHLGSIPVLPPKNATRQLPHQSEESLTNTLTIFATGESLTGAPAALAPLGCAIGGGQGVGEALHQSLSNLRPLRCLFLSLVRASTYALNAAHSTSAFSLPALCTANSACRPSLSARCLSAYG